MTLPHERVLKADDGTQLFVTDWPVNATRTDAKNVRGGIVILHGLGEHSGRYLHVVQFFNDIGWSVRTYDHRGHGHSGGPRGDTPASDTLIRDAKIIIDDFAKQLTQAPVLLGHSMGGLLAARVASAALSPLRGLILSSPALAITLSRFEQFLLTTLSALAPGFGVSSRLKTQYLSHDPAVVAMRKDDLLAHSSITARMLRSMLDAADFSQAHATALRIPTLLLVAGDDRLVDAQGSRRFFDQLAPGIGTLHWYHGFYHELFNELDARRVLADMQAWLTDR